MCFMKEQRERRVQSHRLVSDPRHRNTGRPRVHHHRRQTIADVSRTDSSGLLRQADAAQTTSQYLHGHSVHLGDVEGLIRTDHTAATRWINTHDHGESASPQPWHALAAVYDRNGHPAEARRLRFTAANKVTKTAPPTTKVARWGYLLAAGHGYYPLVAAFWLLVALIGGVALVDMNREHFVPTTISAATMITASGADGPKDSTVITGADVCSTHPQYPCLDSFSYALTGVIPSAAGITRPDWSVSSAGL